MRGARSKSTVVVLKELRESAVLISRRVQICPSRRVGRNQGVIVTVNFSPVGTIHVSAEVCVCVCCPLCIAFLRRASCARS